MKCYNSVSFKLRSSRYGGRWLEYCCSPSSHVLTFILNDSCHIIANTEAIVRGIHNIHRKTTMPENLYWHSCRPIKKETPTQNSSRTLPGDYSRYCYCYYYYYYYYYYYIYIFFKQFLSRIPEIIGTFREKFIFQIIGSFLLFMSSF